jgi:Xaa-Pro dipeptidase
MTFGERMRGLPAEAGVDALVAVSPENFAYVSQTYILTTRTLPPRQALAILPREGEPVALVCSVERAHVEEESWITAIRTYVEFADHPMDALADALEGMGVSGGRLGIDLQFLPQASYARLADRLPGLDIVDTTDVVARARSIKTPEEIAKVESGQKGTHTAAIEAMEQSRLGETEKVMADRLVNGMIANGADGTMFLIFGTGPRSSLTHALPTARVPTASEIIRFDYGGTFGPWMSDVARTYSTGEPTELQRGTYHAVWEAEIETFASIRPGITAEDIFFTGKAAFEKRGVRFFMPHIGHSLGVELHEAPMLRPGDTTVIRPGMTLNVELLTVDADGSGYQLEDTALVTEDGMRLLTHGFAPPEIPVIGRPLHDP